MPDILKFVLSSSASRRLNGSLEEALGIVPAALHSRHHHELLKAWPLAASSDLSHSFGHRRDHVLSQMWQGGKVRKRRDERAPSKVRALTNYADAPKHPFTR